MNWILKYHQHFVDLGQSWSTYSIGLFFFPQWFILAEIHRTHMKQNIQVLSAGFKSTDWKKQNRQKPLEIENACLCVSSSYKCCSQPLQIQNWQIFEDSLKKHYFPDQRSTVQRSVCSPAGRSILTAQHGLWFRFMLELVTYSVGQMESLRHTEVTLQKNSITFL